MSHDSTLLRSTVGGGVLFEKDFQLRRLGPNRVSVDFSLLIKRIVPTKKNWSQQTLALAAKWVRREEGLYPLIEDPLE